MSVKGRKPQPKEAAPQAPNSAAAPIIGIGASAGGIDALQKFFPAVAADAGLSFVVVQHLAPDHKSILTELLGRATVLPVTLVDTDTKVEPNHVYVIPPNAVLTIKNGRLQVSKPAPRHHRMPIDNFFVSLAKDQGENAACVILSGTGSDGTIGLTAIKENGGLTLAQTSDSAEYDGMMRSAIATGLVDLELPAEEMPAKISDYFRHLSKLEGDYGSEQVVQDLAAHLGEFYGLLSRRTGHNFTGYKDNTVIRRLQRRMQLLQVDRAAALLERLRKEPRELDLLFQDLLIGVTNFFRDSAAFAALKDQVIPNLFEARGSDGTIRVWVPGCSTGEEAYSIAMLLREQMPKTSASPKLQIFATDINERALEVARAGRYPASIEQDVSPERLERFFLREDGAYRVVADLREMCLFSTHNLLRDPPFSKLDLISCRNLMIYLDGDLQDRVIPLFHYALRHNGYLFLGTSENITRHSRLFATIDKPNRVFKRLPADRKPVSFPLTPADPTPWGPGGKVPRFADRSLMGLAERQILDLYAPAFVVINAEGEVLQASGRTGKYLELPVGTPDTNVFGLARRGLRLELRAAVRKSTSTGQQVVQDNVSVIAEGGRQRLKLIVQPLQTDHPADALYMVVFQDLGDLERQLGKAELASEIDGASRQMELELLATKERLQTTTEELESSNEELKSANEELSSMNEELQSSNQELETSKEDLQSTNEELHTVNAELNSRVEELSRANSDVRNLLDNTQIATIFIDRDLTVKSFTPAAKDLFHLADADAGRPIAHIRRRFALDTLQEDIDKVLRTLGTIERFVHSGESDALYVARILPYRTVDEVIGGVVLTFTDITRITAAEARVGELTHDLRDRLDSLETLLDLVPIGILLIDFHANERTRINQYGARLLGEESSGKGLRLVAGPLRLFDDGEEIPANEQPLQRAIRTTESVPSFEGRLLRADGGDVAVMMSANPLFDEAGKVRGAIAAIVDITERKKADAHQQELLHELQHRVKNILATVSSLAIRMLKNDPTIKEFSESFLARLATMSTMHEMLSDRRWEGAELGDLLVETLTPYATPEKDNIALDGPGLLLKPDPAATLGLAFFELASNAAKYGALSTIGGLVDVKWRIEDAPDGKQLSLTWIEQGGPPIKAPPKRKGFGTAFVKRSIEHELQGAVDLTFSPTGLRCSIVFPLRGNVTADAPGPRRQVG
jgi:two-component system CheB/CheR fusion protein